MMIINMVIRKYECLYLVTMGVVGKAFIFFISFLIADLGLLFCKTSAIFSVHM